MRTLVRPNPIFSYVPCPLSIYPPVHDVGIQALNFSAFFCSSVTAFSIDLLPLRVRSFPLMKPYPYGSRVCFLFAVFLSASLSLPDPDLAQKGAQTETVALFEFSQAAVPPYVSRCVSSFTLCCEWTQCFLLPISSPLLQGEV